MDIQPKSTQPISDDQELAKVLAGIGGDADDAGQANEEIVTTPAPAQPPAPAPEPAASVPAPEPVAPAEPAAALPPMPAPAAAGELDDVKKEAITELRPLVDKLNLAPEEKFDTLLLLIRSTDDKTLIAPAHDAAKEITDESRRAQALLDIIKEIDFLSGQQPAA